MLPNYCQEHDIAYRFERKMHFYLTDRVTFSFVPTVDPEWWCIVMVDDEIIPYLEVRAKTPEIAAEIKAAVRKFCQSYTLGWVELINPISRKRDAK